MEIVGSGFLAKNLRSIAHLYPDTVVFAAGVSSGYGAAPEEFDRDAALVYETLDRCARTGRRIAYFSTSSAGMYGVRLAVCSEDGPVFPTSSYGRHKLAMESVIARSGVDHLILRLAYPVGPDQREHQFLPSLVGQIRRGSVRVRRGARRDIIHVDDVVALVDALLAGGASGETVNVASGTAMPVGDIVEYLEFRLGVSAGRQYEDVPAEPTVCIAKLRRLAGLADQLGFGPEYYRDAIDRYLGTAVPD
ncbi:NAD-dependent epimerase [Longispora fulva]|uniref:Nucleoside-diphosphate-sugar epimerase n=1 Tax=Longispora fulva TaxID=619741 RepID=A0A8J7GD38_9ACTN|nr:NAD-dependent epimerase/dehydratase family protein [Longispora fulva]MBG6134227.1 nucleoside-diphosphate-sugar epimerase [Longispora fulva]GIG63119.1 NAD-dependent epimerase [Longispora fulva]